jgi:hypothetical protein
MTSMEEASNDESIPPIVAFAAHNGDSLAPYGPEPWLKARDNARPGVFHQYGRWDVSL